MTDPFVIVGSGIAGLRAALALAPHGAVVILTKANPSAGSTGYAQGGIAAAVGDDDSPALHAKDTIAAGDGLCNPAAVDVLVHEGPSYVRELIASGADFDRDADGHLALAREGAHSVRRVLHARDATGREISRVLTARVREQPNVSVIAHAQAVRLVVEREAVRGVEYLDADGVRHTRSARSVLLATGGAGQVFRETTNPVVAAGDGVALGYLAGARVADLEFVQFHPTVLDVPGVERHLLSEALRGEGARLINSAGDAFMTRYDPAGDLAPRDRVSRAIVLEQQRTGGRVFLTMAHLGASFVHASFPHVSALCKSAGFDLAVDPIPVGPAAHYMMGGLETDLDGRTSIRGLFAAGEVACTGVHGANRLASNSLLEGLVFGARAGQAMAAGIQTSATSPTAIATPVAPPSSTGVIDEATLRSLMWTRAGVFRDRNGLEQARDAIEAAWGSLVFNWSAGRIDADRWRLTSLVTVGRLIVRAALRREESRGAHYRTDFPAKDDLHWLRHVHDDLPSSISFVATDRG